MSAPISASVESSLRENLRARLPDIAGLEVSSEIQDRGEFILLCIDLQSSAEWREGMRGEFLKAMSEDLESELPAREGDYRWMIVVRDAGKVLDSAMGGWLGKSPIV